METSYLVIFTFIFLQRFGFSSNTLITTSSNVTCIKRERQSLLVFKRTLTDTFNLLSTWRGVECCEWQGVGCDDQSGHVVKLDLRSSRFLNYKKLEGELSPSLQNIKHLHYLDLSMNNFLGNVPEFLGSFECLEYLNLTGSFSGGIVPQNLGNLSRLQSLDLSQNSLVGVLSKTHFTKLTNLNYLALSSNSLALNFSSSWIPPFQLEIFIASSCNMIGPHFPNWLQTQINLQRLDLSNSSIRDAIPEWFENILSRILYLDLSNNQISGKLPQFHFDRSNHTWGGILKMNSNKFEGSLATFPSNVKVFDLSDNLLSGDLPQTIETSNSSLEIVSLSNNSFTGRIPIGLCMVPSIQLLDLSQNMFYGYLPRCLGNLSKLQILDITSNNITGVIPVSFAALSDLISLHMHDNCIRGYIPEFLQNLTKLTTMDFGKNFFVGNLPSWIGEKLPSLRFLNLQSNMFTGKIPLQFCQLNTLRYLSLADNNITGTIPHCFGNFSGMMTISGDYYFYRMYYYEENVFASVKGRQSLYTRTICFLTSLDLSNNNLVGEIPDALMDLVGLRNMNFSENLLTGHIPMTIGDLNQLESLDLSLNKLSGQIPQSLSSLHYLSYLNMSFNNLSGPIPVGNQLQTLDDPSIYKANNGLCGPPIPRSCNETVVTYKLIGKDEGQGDNEGFWFYAGMGPGFVFGSMGLLGSLHFFVRWRVTYFKMLENVCGWLMVLLLVNNAHLRKKVFK